MTEFKPSSDLEHLLINRIRVLYPIQIDRDYKYNITYTQINNLIKAEVFLYKRGSDRTPSSYFELIKDRAGNDYWQLVEDWMTDFDRPL